MAAFRFSLEQVLNYRIQLEQQAKVELARVEQERIREQQHADMIQEILAQQQAELDQLGPDRISERWLFENFIKGLRTDYGLAMMRVRNWAKAADAARLELISRAKDRKTLEKLKETQAENHAKEEQLREQREFDETAAIRFKASY